jgi:hypothetical protein
MDDFKITRAKSEHIGETALLLKELFAIEEDLVIE